MRKLFTTHNLSGLELSNRIVMAPMTRSRAINNIPNEAMAEYYSQRASAGLIITEGTSPSPNGLGYARIPGIFSAEQVKEWKKVTAAVHNEGGRIFLQIMHTGRITHPLNLPKNGVVLAPSAVAPISTQIWVDDAGMKNLSVPKEMTTQDIKSTVQEYIEASVNAVNAGFDGVEIHGANGYLIKQFLNPHTNQRTDSYGGTIENRARFLFEITEGIIKAIGKEKVGVRISPFGEYNETPNYSESEATYQYIAKKLNDLDIAYLHVNDQSGKGEPQSITASLRKIFKNTLILAGGYDAGKAEAVLKNNEADLISFGKPFIANPDLVNRYKNKLPLNQPKFHLFYSNGAEGYIDYPVFEDVQLVG
jgi:N-ethylmaleimide reductase